MEAWAGHRDQEPQSNQACLGVALLRAARAYVFGMEVPLGHSGEIKWYEYLRRWKIQNKTAWLQFTSGSETLHTATQEQHEILDNIHKSN